MNKKKAIALVAFITIILSSSLSQAGGLESDGRPSCYARSLGLIEDKTIDVAPIITHRYTSLEALQGALENDMRTPRYLKGVVTL